MTDFKEVYNAVSANTSKLLASLEDGAEGKKDRQDSLEQIIKIIADFERETAKNQ